MSLQVAMGLANVPQAKVADVKAAYEASLSQSAPASAEPVVQEFNLVKFNEVLTTQGLVNITQADLTQALEAVPADHASAADNTQASA